MALSDLKFKGDLWTGVAIGAAMLAAPIVIPMVAAAARPMLKAVLKGGYLVYEKGLEAAASVKEVGEDLFAEVKSEVKTELTEAEQVSEV